MSTIITENKSSQISSHVVRAGKRTYFFDVKSGPKGGLYLSISETAANEGVFTRNRIVVFEGQAKDFYEGLCEAIRSLRQEQRKREPLQVSEPKSQLNSSRKPKAA